MENNNYTNTSTPEISIRVKHNRPLGLGGSQNIHQTERLASLLVGGALLLWLGRRFWGILGMGFFGAWLLYRGLTGHCTLYSAAGIDTSEQNKTPPSAPTGETPLERELRQESQRDKVDERLWESFPASDA